MALETAEAPMVVERMLLKNADAVADFVKLFRTRRPSYLVTCARGSSDHAASYFKYLAEIELGVPVCSMGASVVSIYAARLLLRDTILITISQSGRSPDILSVQTQARRAGVPTVAITNDATSPLAKEADICLPLHAGPELSVAATKTFIASASLAAAIVAALAENTRLNNAVHCLPDALAKAQQHRRTEVEDTIAAAASLYILGRGPSLPMAQEIALKLKETCGIHAEAYSAAEVIHGPMELVTERFPILVLAPKDAAFSTTLANLDRLKHAGANILLPVFTETAHSALDPISLVQSFYLSADRISVALGRDPDRPRLLEKVTRTV
ncbi:SIS domain-containing protein [Mesorhizobium sp. M1423]|uniref:SIS domain-containing protein n=1 Tax=Mesorhizobium sp. M1423 TaxID=2957101 RepID=UPI00333B537F